MSRPAGNSWLLRAALVAAAAGWGACGSEPEPVFPADYAQTYTEVRDCRANGGSHNLNRIRVLADAEALPAYRDRVEPFPVGAVVVKEEYDPNDTGCTGEIQRWTAMERLPDGSEETLNWHWQDVGPDRAVVEENLPRCYGCHADCQPPDGYEGTCTVP